MSALGQKQTSHHVRVMSVIPLKADILQRGLHVRLVPVADIAHVNAITPHTARSPNLNELLQLCCRVDAAENVNRLREIALA